MVLKKGKVIDKFRFSLGEHQIPSVIEKPLKSLGKVFNCSLNDRDSIKATSADLEGDPWKIQGLCLPAWNPPKNPLASTHL